MDHSVSFARHLARLVWVLSNEPANVAEQKAALRALVTLSREGPITVAPGSDGLLANGQPLSSVLSGVRDLIERLAAHSSGGMHVQAAAPAADLLNVARFLVGAPVAGVPLAEQLRAVDATTVHFVPLPSSPREAPPPADQLPAAQDPAAMGDFDLVSDDAIAAVVGQRTPRPSREIAAGPDPSTNGRGLFTQFTSVRDTDGDLALLAELHAASDGAALGVLDRVALVAEQAQGAGKASELVTLLASVIRRGDRAAPEWKRDFTLTQRRLVTAHGLRMIAALVPRRVVPREDVELILTRAGEDGADAVIDHLTQASSATDRRAYFELLLTLRAGIPALIHMLGDERWFVVRNGVDLLGEMGVAEAEPQITGLLQHADARVRSSATAALLRLDTPTSRAAVYAALRSDSPATRQQAVTALALKKTSNTAGTLLRALDREADESVQRTIYTALGKVASPDAVQRLIDAAAPAAGLFRRKAPALRAAAAAALGEAATPEARTALRGLAEDRDREVREAAGRALASRKAPAGEW